MDYTKNNYHTLRHGKLNLNTENYISKCRIQKINRILELRKFEKILEAGVGYGWNFKFHINKIDGYDKINVLTNTNINFLTNNKLIPESYDLIVCHHVLEHIPDPLEFINYNLHLLKPNGQLLIFVPIEVKSSWLPSNKDLDNHYYSWTPRQLSNLIKDNIPNTIILKSIYLKFGFDRRAGEISSIFGFRITQLLQKLLLIILPRYESCCLIKKVSS